MPAKLPNRLPPRGGNPAPAESGAGQCRCVVEDLLARTRSAGMSAIPPFLEAKRTCRRHRENNVHDPMLPTCALQQVGSYLSDIVARDIGQVIAGHRVFRCISGLVGRPDVDRRANSLFGDQQCRFRLLSWDQDNGLVATCEGHSQRRSLGPRVTGSSTLAIMSPVLRPAASTPQFW